MKTLSNRKGLPFSKRTTGHANSRRSKLKQFKRNVLTLIGIALGISVLTSCGLGLATVQNQNQNSTQVHLSESNYKIVNRVKGSSEVSYVLIFGGKDKLQLYQDAHASMVEEADLGSGSRALVNLSTEEHIGGWPPFHYTRTITVSAHVIEFTD